MHHAKTIKYAVLNLVGNNLSIQDSIKDDIKRSLRAGDRFRCEALKLVLASLVNAAIAKRSDLTDEEAIAVLQKEIKKRREAAEIFLKTGSEERSASELKEAEIIEEYTPDVIKGPDLERLVMNYLTQNSAVTFPEAMQYAIKNFGNVDRSELATILKSKLDAKH